MIMNLWMGDSAQIVTVSVAKHRNGPTGDVEMLFIKDYTSFQNHLFKNGIMMILFRLMVYCR